jgi:predicted TIM-barrel fold metal-dependent hydrolase
MSIMAYWTATEICASVSLRAAAAGFRCSRIAWTGTTMSTPRVRDMPAASNDYLNSDQVLVGVEGNEWILPYVIKQCGAEAFAYASDYPHEVDLMAAKEMIHDTVERSDLTHAEKAAVLGENAKRFFRL